MSKSLDKKYVKISNKRLMAIRELESPYKEIGEELFWIRAGVEDLVRVGGDVVKELRTKRRR